MDQIRTRITLAVALVVLTGSLVVPSSHQVQAQTQTQTQTQKTAAEIASEIEQVKNKHTQCTITSCIQVEYDSPTTVVMSGEYLLLSNPTIAEYVPNTILWQAVDTLKS